MNQVQTPWPFPIATKARKSIPGTYATGKGTTARIRNFFSGLTLSYGVDEIAADLGVPARQLNKRVNELVKKGFLMQTYVENGRKMYARSGTIG
jgi:predicted DNA-binding transcriptional regulator